jgi:hypothetical protein
MEADMATTPTPDEALRALRDVEHRRDQSVEAAGWPRWTWIAGGVLVPQFVRTWGTPIIVLLLLLALAANTRRGGALLRRPVRPRTSFDAANTRRLALALIVLIGAGAVAATLDVPHVALWSGLAGGLLLAVAGPWWQRRVLTRAARP